MLADIFKNRLFIGALVFFVLCVAGSLLYMHHENQKGAEYAAETEDRVRQWNAKQKEQSPAEAPVVEQPEQVGHFHEDGTFHAEPHAPITESSPVDVATPTRTGPLTYHAELLDHHPVEALRLQAEERGHWSARWIPPFPPGDTEAATLARNAYLVTYYQSVGDLDNPEYIKAVHEYTAQTNAIAYDSDYSNGNARPYDLMKLSWVTMHEPVPGTRSLPSDYF